MPGKKAHHPRENAKKPAGANRKSSAQTEGQFGRDPKGRTGQFTAAGDPPLMKK